MTINHHLYCTARTLSDYWSEGQYLYRLRDCTCHPSVCADKGDASFGAMLANEALPV